MYNNSNIYKYTTMLKNYQSDFTKFINKYLDDNPEIQKKQIENRRTWWDKKRDFEFEKLKKSKLAQKKPYEYY